MYFKVVNLGEKKSQILQLQNNNLQEKSHKLANDF